jgi:uncharacterized Ntn-hydrolase superfamily protein
MTSNVRTDGAILSISARDPATNALGIAIAATSLAIGGRCAHLSPGLAVIASQGFTNLKMGALAADLLRCGLTTQEVAAALRQHDRWIEYRQFAIVSVGGDLQAFTGEKTAPWAGHLAVGGGICAGNGLANRAPLETMMSHFVQSAGGALSERLLSCLEAGRSALGASRQFNSSLLLTRVGDEEHIDLRIDKLAQQSQDAVRELRLLFEDYKPLAPVYQTRSSEPKIG